jgi:L-threonylcarbamoyladenylate synthase
MGVSPTRAEHVARGMADRVDVILDGGPADVGLESTVLDLTGAVPTVLRLGGLPVSRLREVLGRVDVWADAEGEPTVHLPSPGLARRHYAPRATVHLVAGREALIAQADALLAEGERVGVLALGASAWPTAVEAEAMPDSPAAYGARLYAALHAMDALGITHLLVETPPGDEEWGAVRDRLRRATSR